MMNSRTDAVDQRAVIVMDQFAAACKLVFENDGNFEGLPELYLKLLRPLYTEDYAIARLSDSSDLLARYTGPAVDKGAPRMKLVTSVFSILQKQVQNIAQSVVDLGSPTHIKWPDALAPQLTGLAPGSLIAGITIPTKNEATDSQFEFTGISDEIHSSVKSALQLLSIVPRYVDDKSLDQSIEGEIPDPALRDTIMLAASNLAPTGKKGINQVFLRCQGSSETPIKSLTPTSRKTILQYLDKPLKTLKDGSFQGVIREIDLDKRRFHIRQVEGVGAIRCKYSNELDKKARGILDATVVVKGQFEENEKQQPSLMDVMDVEILKTPEEQLILT